MPDPSLKILISIGQDTKAQLQGLAKDFRDISAAVKGVDFSSLNNAGKVIKTMADGQKELTKNTKESAESLKTQAGSIETLKTSVEGLTGAVKFLAGGFLALESIRFFKELADNAARAQVLGTVLSVVGKNAGYTAAELKNADNAVQRMGITAQASRQSLATLITANIDLAKAADLARAAQDLALISGENSSQTFQRLIHAIEVRSTMDLRFLGINVRLEQAESKYAATLGKSAAQLTQREQSEAVLAAVMENATRRAGTYTEAMGDVGKQLTSLERLSTNLSTSLGQQLLPAYLAIVQELSLFLEQLTSMSDEANSASDGGQRLGKIVQSVASAMREAALIVASFWKEIGALAAAFVTLVGASGTAAFFQTAFGESLIANIKLVVGLATELIAYAQVTLYVAATEGVFATATDLATVAMNRLTVAMARNPWGIVLVALALLITAIGTFTVKLHDSVKDATWGETLRGEILFVLQPFTVLIDKIKEFKDALLSIPDRPLGIISGSLKEAGVDVEALDKDFHALFDGIISFAERAGKAIKYFIGDYIKGTLSLIINNTLLSFPKTVAQMVQEQKDKDSQEAGKNPYEVLRIKEQRKLDADRALQAAKDGTDEEKEIAKQRYNAAKDDVTNQAKKILASATSTPAQRAAAQDAKDKNDFQIDSDNADAERAKTFANGSVGPDGFGLRSPAFQEAYNAFRDTVKERFNPNYKPVKGEADPQTVLTSIALKAAEAATANRGDQKDLKELLFNLNYLGGAKGDDATRLKAKVGDAQYKAADEGRELFAAQASRHAEDVKNADQTIVNSAEESAKHIQNANKVVLDSAKESYDTGQIGLLAYYEKRRAIIKSNEDAQIDVLKAKAKQAEDATKNGALTRQQRDAAVITATQAQVAITEEQETASLQRKDLELEQAKEILAANQRIADLNVQVAKDTGGYLGELVGIDEKWEKIAKSVKAFAPDIDEGTKRLIESGKAADYLQARLKEMDRQSSEEERRSNALIEAQRNNLNGATANGRLTEQQKMLANNDLITQQQDVVARKIDVLAAKVREVEESALAFLKLNPGGNTDSFANQLEGLKTQGQELENQYEQLGNSIETYGQKIRDSFETSVSGALTNLVTNFRQAQNTLVELGKSLEKTVLGGLSENVTKKLFNSISDSTSKLDENGKPIQGTSIFDGLGKVFGLGDKEPVGTVNNPIHLTPEVTAALLARHDDRMSKASTVGVGGTTSYTASESLQNALGGGGTTTLPSEIGGALGGATGAKIGTLVDGLTKAATSSGGTGSGAAPSFNIPTGQALQDKIANKTLRLLGLTPTGGPNNLASIKRQARSQGPVGDYTDTADYQVGSDSPDSPATGAAAPAAQSGRRPLPQVDLNSLSGLPDATPSVPSSGGASGDPNAMELDPFDYAQSNAVGDASKALSGLTNIAGKDFGPEIDSAISSGLGFAHGGVIGGRGHDTSDNIPILVSPGEHITRAKQTRKWLPLLNMINNDTLPVQSIALPGGVPMPKFAAGGMVGGVGSHAATTPAPGASMPTLMLHPDMANWTVKDVVSGIVADSYAGR
jgi:hypothetical protein